jgi:Domain of unknown function (DUF222)
LLLDPPVPHPGGPAEGGPPGHPVLRFADSLSRGLDAVSGVAAWSMTPEEQRQALVGLRRQRARLAELELRVLAAADRNQVGAESGATSTAAWLAEATGCTRAACFAEVRLAHALDGPFEATRRALANGTLDVDRAAVIVHAVQALSAEHDQLPEGTPAAAEAHLVDLAARFDARTLRMLGKRLFEVVCPDAADAHEGRTLAAEEARAHRLAYLSVRDNGDGTSEGRFRLPTLHAHLLTTALETLTSPRRLGQTRFDPATGKPLPRATLFGHGLIELLERHLNLHTMPGSDGCPFTLVVTVALDTLRTGLGLGTVDTGHRISAGEVRRLACRAGIIPMVLDGKSMPLDLGRKKRLFSRYQKIALNHRFGGCAAVNCDRPPGWTEAHHEHPWSHGGATDLKHGIPLCPPHHHMADHPETWHLHRAPTGGVRFTRRQ